MKRFFLIFILLLASSSTRAADIYIAQSAAGGNNGADCADAYAYTDATHGVNIAGNWKAGNTLHLCGTITGAAGGTLITAAGSGSSGSPITIKFESGAIIQAPYWSGYNVGGAIYVNGKSWIVIDGGGTGIIQATANGTNLANQQGCAGIVLNSVSNVTIQNLTIQGMYANAGSQPSATDPNGQLSMDIELSGSLTNVTINKNTLMASRMGVNTNLSGNVSGLTISNNTFSDHAWMMALTQDSTHTFANVTIAGNNFTNWDNWQFPNSVYHTDGIITWMGGNNPNPYTPVFFNNYFHGNLGDGNSTGYIYLSTDLSGNPVNFSGTLFNNLFLSDDHTTYNGGPPPGFTAVVMNTTTGPHYFYNNTIVAPIGAGQALFEQFTGGVRLTLENNIFSGFCNAFLDNGTAASDVVASNGNVFYNQCNGGDQVITDVTGQMTLAKWKAHGFDANSVSTNPLLNGDGTLQPGSSAIGIGLNLSTLGITALDSDFAGTSRLPPWDAGAFNYTVPTARTGVSESGVVVQ